MSGLYVVLEKLVSSCSGDRRHWNDDRGNFPRVYFFLYMYIIDFVRFVELDGNLKISSHESIVI